MHQIFNKNIRFNSLTVSRTSAITLSCIEPRVLFPLLAFEDINEARLLSHRGKSGNLPSGGSKCAQCAPVITSPHLGN